MCKNSELKIEEYRSLMEEHRKNRSYIFERPIIILGVIAFAMQYFGQSDKSIIGQIVFICMIFILMFNLWFTVHRLQSDFRLVAYIMLVHEGELSKKWIGWENALRRYRIWTKSQKKKKKKLDELVKKEINPKAFSSRVMFYPAIWVLHLVLVIFLFLAALDGFNSSIINLNLNKGNFFEIIKLVALTGMTITFLIYAFFPLRPRRLISFTELKRAIWIHVFKEIEVTTEEKNSKKKKKVRDGA